MTATPKRFVASAKKKASDEGYTIASMDDPSKFGDVAHQLPFGEAIKKGLLTDYQAVIAVTAATDSAELTPAVLAGLDEHLRYVQTRVPRDGHPFPCGDFAVVSLARTD
jgi:predicted helicase